MKEDLTARVWHRGLLNCSCAVRRCRLPARAMERNFRRFLMYSYEMSFLPYENQGESFPCCVSDIPRKDYKWSFSGWKLSLFPFFTDSCIIPWTADYSCTWAQCDDNLKLGIRYALKFRHKMIVLVHEDVCWPVSRSAETTHCTLHRPHILHSFQLFPTKN